jgi:hypothetical protein
VNTKTKFSAAIAALVMAATIALPATEAQAQRRFGTGLAIGLVGGALAATAIANANAGYVGPVRRCKLVSRYDNWGNYRGTFEVCRSYW